VLCRRGGVLQEDVLQEWQGHNLVRCFKADYSIAFTHRPAGEWTEHGSNGTGQCVKGVQQEHGTGQLA